MNLFNEINIINELCFDFGTNISNKTEKFLSYGTSFICIEPQTYCNSILESKLSDFGFERIETSMTEFEWDDALYINNNK